MNKFSSSYRKIQLYIKSCYLNWVIEYHTWAIQYDPEYLRARKAMTKSHAGKRFGVLFPFLFSF